VTEITWADFRSALVEMHALPVAGLSLLIVGATFRWFEPLSRLLGYRRETPADAWWITPRPSEGSLDSSLEDEAAARRREEILEDHLRRLADYGRMMMVVGIVLFLLSVSLQ
jgi:hypothetical protein